jgi:hypothetical protein
MTQPRPHRTPVSAVPDELLDTISSITVIATPVLRDVLRGDRSGLTPQKATRLHALTVLMLAHRAGADTSREMAAVLASRRGLRQQTVDAALGAFDAVYVHSRTSSQRSIGMGLKLLRGRQITVATPIRRPVTKKAS